MSRNRSRHLVVGFVTALLMLLVAGGAFAAAPTIDEWLAPVGTVYYNTAPTGVTVKFVYTSDTEVTADVTLTDGTTTFEGTGNLLAGTTKIGTITVPNVAEGTYSVEVTLTNTSDTTTASAPGSVVVDKTPPSIGDVGLYANPPDGAFIKSARPDISISRISDAGSGIESAKMFLNGNEVSATLAGDTLSYHPSSDLGLGKWTVDVSVTDKAGNINDSCTWTFNIDTDIPLVTLNVAQTNVGDETPTLTAAISDQGTVDPDLMTYVLRLDGVVKKSGTVGDLTYNSGIYTLGDFTVTEGSHTAVLEVTDAAGNVGSDSVTFTVDKSKPVIGAVSPAGGYIAVEPGTDTADVSMVVDSIYPAADIITELVVNNVSVGAADYYNADTKTFYWTGVSVNETTENTLVFHATNPNGVVADEKQVKFTYDPTPPSVAITGPATPTSNNTPTIAFTVTEDNFDTSAVVVKLDGVAISPSTSSQSSPYAYTYTPTAALTDGTHTLTVKATDKAGRTSPIQAYSFVVDTTGPTVVAGSVYPAAWTHSGEDTVSIKFTDAGAGMASADSIVSAYIDGAPIDSMNRTYSYDSATKTATVSATSGTAFTAGGILHTAQVTVADSLGNETTYEWTFRVDDAAPTVTFGSLSPSTTSGSDIIVTSTSATLTVTLSDTQSGIDPTAVDVYLGIDTGAPQNVGSMTVSGNTGTFKLENLAQLDTGHEYRIYIDAADQVGNSTGSPTLTQLKAFKVNLTNQLAFTDLPRAYGTTNTNVTATISAPAGFLVQTVKLFVNGTEVTVPGTPAQTITINHAPGAADGDTVSYEIRATGNWPGAVEQRVSGQFVVDVTDPVITAPTATAYATLRPSLAFTVTDATSGVASAKVQSFKVGTVDVPYTESFSGGTLTVTPTGDLSEVSTYAVVVEAEDNAGNSTTATAYNFTVDVTAPAATVSITNTVKYTKTVPAYVEFKVDGLASGDSIDYVAVKTGGVEIARVEAPATTTGKILLGATAPDGKYTIEAKVKDALGNSKVVSGAATNAFFVDTQAPAITIEPADGSVWKNVEKISVSVTDTYGINYTDLSTYTFKVDGTPVSGLRLAVSHVVDAVSGFATSLGLIYVPESLAEGTHEVSVTVVDALGHVATKTTTFDIDRTAPTIGEVTPAEGSLTKSTVLTVSITGAVSASLELDGVAVSATFAGGVLTYEGLTNGNHHAKVTAVDAAGNESEWTWSFTVDTVAPEIGEVSPAAGSLSNKTVLTAKITGATSATLKLDGADVAGATFADGVLTFEGLTDGEHTAIVTAVDAAGNQATKEWSFTIDTVGPTITGLMPADGTTVNISKSTIRAKIAGYDNIQLVVNGEAIASDKYSVFNGKLVYALPTLKFNEDIVVELTLTDAAGNVTTKKATFKIEQYREGFGFGRLFFE